MIRNKYLKGTSILCRVKIKDNEGNLINPDNMWLRITNPSGVVKTEVPMGNLTHEETGIFSYIYQIPEDAENGDWRYKFETSAQNISIDFNYFTVIDIPQGLYCSTSDVYRKMGITEDEISPEMLAQEIREAQAEVDQIMQRKFYPNQEVQEWFDIKGHWSEEINDLFLRWRPVQNFIALEEYDMNGNLIRTFSSDDYYLDYEEGILHLRLMDFEHQRRRVKAIYQYGYDEVPYNIQDLTATIAGIRGIIHQMGGVYNNVAHYSLPSGVSVSLGQPYMSMKNMIDDLTKKKEVLLETIGRMKHNDLVI